MAHFEFIHHIHKTYETVIEADTQEEAELIFDKLTLNDSFLTDVEEETEIEEL